MEDKEIKYLYDGRDIWEVLAERTVVDLKNPKTSDTLTCDKSDKRFFPVYLPDMEDQPEKKTTETKKKTVKTHSRKKSGYTKSKYKGVRKTPSGQFEGHYWDKAKGKVIHRGTFSGELLAVAAVEEALGNTEEAKRLRNEYEEGNRLPEPSDSKPEEKYKGVYPKKTKKGIRYHAQITHNKKLKHLGTHDTIRQAAEAIEDFKKEEAERLSVKPGQFPAED